MKKTVFTTTAAIMMTMSALSPMTAMAASNWVSHGDTWYYTNEDGSYRTGWVLDNGSWYYMNPEMVTCDWVKSGDDWYFMLEDGRMLSSGWVWQENTSEPTGKEWYYIGADGKMVSNSFVTWKGETYYMGTSGQMLASRWLKVEDDWYYFNKNGCMVKNTSFTAADKYVYGFDEDGKMIMSLPYGSDSYWEYQYLKEENQAKL